MKQFSVAVIIEKRYLDNRWVSERWEAIGVHGAYNSMKTGYVDETWAREHHEQWYNDVKAGRSGHPQG